MAKYDKRRLFWIKLTDTFMSGDTVDFLMSQKEGANYVVLYQMLCLKTVNNGGVLAGELGEILVPYNIEKIQRDCKWFSIDTVRHALNLYMQLGLVYEINNGILAISDFDELVGSQTYGAAKKAVQKQKKLPELTKGGQKVENFPPEIEKEIEIKKEKEIYKEIHSLNLSTETDEYISDKIQEAGFEGEDADAYRKELLDNLKLKYLGGELGQGVVFMSPEQFDHLCNVLSLDELEKYMGIVAGCEKNGKRYKKKSHYQAILDMVKSDRRVQG